MPLQSPFRKSAIFKNIGTETEGIEEEHWDLICDIVWSLEQSRSGDCTRPSAPVSLKKTFLFFFPLFFLTLKHTLKA